MNQPIEPTACELAPGELFDDLSGPLGGGWRVVEGALCLVSAQDRTHTALLALPGDLLGLEASLLGRCPYRLVALVPAKLQALAPAVSAVQARDRLGAMLEQQWRRTMQMTDLRTGKVADRVKVLLLLLRTCSHDGELRMPRQRDLAATVDSTQESMSRVMAYLRRTQLVTCDGHRRRHRTSEALAAAALPAGLTSPRSYPAAARAWLPAHGAR